MNHAISTQDIGIIVLAAGSSVRFGDDKRLALLSSGKSILETTLDCIPASFTRRLLVLKADDETLAQRFGEQWEICIATAPEEGLANSLASAIAKIEDWDDWKGALIALADMPFIDSSTYSALQTALKNHEIVQPVVNGKRGNPVGFRQKYFQEIVGLTGDQGAKALLRKYKEDVFEYNTQDEGIFKDIDKPEMLT